MRVCTGGALNVYTNFHGNPTAKPRAMPILLGMLTIDVKPKPRNPDFQSLIWFKLQEQPYNSHNATPSVCQMPTSLKLNSLKCRLSVMNLSPSQLFNHFHRMCSSPSYLLLSLNMSLRLLSLDPTICSAYSVVLQRLGPKYY